MIRIFSLLLISLFVCSCVQNNVFDEYKVVPKVGWHKDSIKEFKLVNMDSLKEHNLFFNIRSSNSYPFSNLYIIGSLQFPNGKKIIDTLEYQMALPNGEWLGTGGVSIKENKLWFKENFKFTEEGEYKISVSHAMRKNCLLYTSPSPRDRG